MGNSYVMILTFIRAPSYFHIKALCPHVYNHQTLWFTGPCSGKAPAMQYLSAMDGVARTPDFRGLFTVEVKPSYLLDCPWTSLVVKANLDQLIVA